MFEDILYETHEGIATITINRPKVRNAVRPRTYEELTEAMKTAADDPEVAPLAFQAIHRWFVSTGSFRACKVSRYWPRRSGSIPAEA